MNYTFIKGDICDAVLVMPKNFLAKNSAQKLYLMTIKLMVLYIWLLSLT